MASKDNTRQVVAAMRKFDTTSANGKPGAQKAFEELLEECRKHPTYKQLPEAIDAERRQRGLPPL